MDSNPDTGAAFRKRKNSVLLLWAARAYCDEMPVKSVGTDSGTAAYFCTDKVAVPGTEPRTEMEVIRQGTVDGVPVGILLNTGSTQTFVRRNLVPENNIVVGKTVSVSCIHGESTQLADIDVMIGGNHFRVRAGVSDKLPVQLLLGHDVPKLSGLLGTSVGSTSSQSSAGSRSESSVGSRSESSVGSTSSESIVGSISSQSSVGVSSTSSESNVDSSSPVTSGSLDAVAVTTQAQSRRQGEGVGQAVVTAEPESEENPRMDFDDELFGDSRESTRLTRRQKRYD